MGEIKPWQLIVIAVAVIVLGFSAWRFMSGNGIDQPDGIMTVDIKTGQLYDVKKGSAKGMRLPVEHPDTGERTLYPVELNEQNEWVIIEHYAGGIDDRIRQDSLLGDEGYGIKILDSDPIKHVIRP